MSPYHYVDFAAPYRVSASAFIRIPVFEPRLFLRRRRLFIPAGPLLLHSLFGALFFFRALTGLLFLFLFTLNLVKASSCAHSRDSFRAQDRMADRKRQQRTEEEGESRHRSCDQYPGATGPPPGVPLTPPHEEESVKFTPSARREKELAPTSFSTGLPASLL